MKLTQGLSSFIGNFKIRNEIGKLNREHEAVGFEEAKNIGILYDATDATNFEVVKAYVKSLRNRQKDILALGYVDKKELPSNQYAQYGLDFFTRKHLNWQRIPNHRIVSNFISEKFDILINLSNNNCFPLRYITALSNARFRVGQFNRRNMMCYEMMIDTNGEEGIKGFIEEVENYLRQIKRT